MNQPINVTPRPTVDTSHRLLAMLSHGALFLGAPLLLPLILYIVTRKDRSTVPQHAAEAFNFHLTYTLWALLCLPLTLVAGLGMLLLFILGITTFICAIIGIVKAANDEVYRYPLTLRLLGEMPPREEILGRR